MPPGILELATAIVLATGLGFLARFLRQPLLLAYLLTGAIISYFGFFDLINHETFNLFADLGIMFLLFLVGLEINYESLKIVGKLSVIIGLGQIVVTALFGYLIAMGFGFAPLASLYIAAALTFSSTIIIVKLLSDKKDLHSLYGKIALGFMLVQDAVAIIILMALSGLGAATGGPLWAGVYLLIIKGLALFAVILWLSKRVFPPLFDRIAQSQELLFLTSTAWVLLVAAVTAKIGFSIEIAGFLAGLALANSSENFQIASKIRPLRDFFILIFFVILGASFTFSNVAGLGWPIVVFSLFVLIGNPLIVLVLMGLMGYRRRTGFLAGITVAQISEFSLIMIALGLKLGHVSPSEVSLITGVGIITIVLSTYMIIYGETLYRLLSPLLLIFERSHPSEPALAKPGLAAKIVLMGFGRNGQALARHLPKRDLLVVDFDPEIAVQAKSSAMPFLFGDLADPEIFDRAVGKPTKLIISTSSDLEDNLLLLELAHKRGKRAVVVRAETENQARALYGRGAAYVILPHFSAGQRLGHMLAHDDSSKTLTKLKNEDLALLK